MIYSMLSPVAGPKLPIVKTAGGNQQKVIQKPVFTKKENATLEQRIEILDWHHANGKNQSKTAKHFNTIYPNLQLKQPRISNWCKNEEKWREEYETSSAHSAKWICQTQHPQITKMLDLWVSKAMADKILLTGEVLCQRWRSFADLAGIPEDEQLSLSEGWLTRYKTRTGLKNIKRHSEAASVASEVVEKEQQCVQELIKRHGYQLRDIFNTDESGLCYA
jgi:Fe-S cluster assembly scaffold protein SufB